MPPQEAIRQSAATPKKDNLIAFIALRLARKSSVGIVNSSSALSEECFLLFVEGELNDLLNTILAEDTGNADAEVFFAIFAFEQSGASDETLLVVEHGSSNLS